jgi:hypothetical protein
MNRWEQSRDPDRIERVLGEVETFWREHPDWRLGQVIVNASRRMGIDPFAIEEDHLLNGLRRLDEDAQVELSGTVWRSGEPVPDGDLRIWLDDDLVDRAAPEGWVHVTTAWAAQELLATARVVELSLDHDLSDDEQFGKGVNVIDFIAEQQEAHGRDLWPRDGITIHSANAAGREQMARGIERYASERHPVRRTITPGGKLRLLFDQASDHEVAD